jgi:hypothetical protein
MGISNAVNGKRMCMWRVFKKTTPFAEPHGMSHVGVRDFPFSDAAIRGDLVEDCVALSGLAIVGNRFSPGDARG